MEIFAYILAVVMIAATVFAIFHIIASDDRLKHVSKDSAKKTDHPSLPKPSPYVNDPRPGD